MVNRTISEVCGWKLVPMDVATEWPDTGEPPHWDSVRYHPIPNYTGSLDAMAKARRYLTPAQWAVLVRELEKITREECENRFPNWRDLYASALIDILLVDSTADQQARAFLRAVGRWQEKGEK